MPGERMIMGLLYFTLYSFIGWNVESCYTRIRSGQWVNRGLLFGPFIPLYGFGAILIVFISGYIPYNISPDILRGYDLRPFILYLLSFFLLPLLEHLLIGGLEAVSRIRWRDGRREGSRRGGRKELLRSAYWGFWGTALILGIHPALAVGMYEAPFRYRFVAAVFFFIYFIIDAAASLLRLNEFRKTMEEWESLAAALHRKLYHKQEEYEQGLRDYEDRRLQQQQKWRQSADEARSGLRQDPAAGWDELDGKMEQANQTLRDALRQMKEELAETAKRRDAAIQAYQENLSGQLNQELDSIRDTHRFRNLYHVFRAFPDITPAPTFRPFSPDRDNGGPDQLMITAEISVTGYLWREVRERMVHPG